VKCLIIYNILIFQHFDTVCKTRELPSLFLTWEFYNDDIAYTPVKAAETCIEFNSSSVHRVTINDEFLQYLEEVREVIGKLMQCIKKKDRIYMRKKSVQ
jgi:hypothetical protein